MQHAQPVRYIVRGRRPSPGLLRFLTVLLSLSGVLIIKPPPYDIVLVTAILFSLFSGKMPVRQSLSAGLVTLGLYVLATIASSFSAATLGEGLWYDGLTVFCALLWWYFAGLFDEYGERCLDAVMNGYVITSCIGVVFGLTVLYFDVPNKQELLYYDRPTGLFLDANVFASSLAPALLYSLVRLARAVRMTGRAGWALSCVVMCAGLLSSLSRGAGVNACVSLFVFSSIIMLKLPSARRTILTIAMTLAAAVGAYAIVTGVFDNNNSIVQRLQFQSYDQERWRVHAAALDLAQEYPILGVGPGQFQTLGSPIQVLYRKKYQSLATHNTYLHILAESGVCTLIPFLVFLALVVRRGLRSLSQVRTQSGILIVAMGLACTVGLLVNGWVIDGYHWRHLWLVCALPWVRVSRPSTVLVHGR
jgi:O-antigen ligase